MDAIARICSQAVAALVAKGIIAKKEVFFDLIDVSGSTYTKKFNNFANFYLEDLWTIAAKIKELDYPTYCWMISQTFCDSDIPLILQDFERKNGLS